MSCGKQYLEARGIKFPSRFAAVDWMAMRKPGRSVDPIRVIGVIDIVKDADPKTENFPQPGRDAAPDVECSLCAGTIWDRELFESVFVKGVPESVLVLNSSTDHVNQNLRHASECLEFLRHDEETGNLLLRHLTFLLGHACGPSSDGDRT